MNATTPAIWAYIPVRAGSRCTHAHKLEHALLDGREPGDRVILDLSGLEFIDSTGLRVIVHAVNAAERGRWELRLRHGPRAVRRVFEISGVLGALPFEDA